MEKLKTLIVEDCDSLEELFEVEEGHATISLPMLKKLHVKKLPKLKHIPWHILPNLKCLTIDDCFPSNKKFLIPATAWVTGKPLLQQLEELKIIKCKHMEAIVGEEEKTAADSGRASVSSAVDVIEFPLLERVYLLELLLLSTFISAGYDVHLPSLKSVDVGLSISIRSFSTRKTIAPKLTSIGFDQKTIAVDEDLNATVERSVIGYQKLFECYPKTLKHRAHKQHELRLGFMRETDTKCGQCGHSVEEDELKFCCGVCDFWFCLTCALKEESQLVEVPNEMKVSKNWPKTLKHELHNEHELKLLVTVPPYYCARCDQMYYVLFSFACFECEFYLHPECCYNEGRVTEGSNSDDKVDDEEDFIATVQRDFNENLKKLKCWPETLEHRAHQQHELELKRVAADRCDVCHRYVVKELAFCCEDCDFAICPNCALEKETQLVKVPTELKVARNWPKTLKNELHDQHRLKLIFVGFVCKCAKCNEKILELFSYTYSKCEFYLHPKCAFKECEVTEKPKGDDKEPKATTLTLSPPQVSVLGNPLGSIVPEPSSFQASMANQVSALRDPLDSTVTEPMVTALTLSPPQVSVLGNPLGSIVVEPSSFQAPMANQVSALKNPLDSTVAEPKATSFTLSPPQVSTLENPLGSVDLEPSPFQPPIANQVSALGDPFDSTVVEPKAAALTLLPPQVSALGNPLGSIVPKPSSFQAQNHFQQILSFGEKQRFGQGSNFETNDQEQIYLDHIEGKTKQCIYSIGSYKQTNFADGFTSQPVSLTPMRDLFRTQVEFDTIVARSVSAVVAKAEARWEARLQDLMQEQLREQQIMEAQLQEMRDLLHSMTSVSSSTPNLSVSHTNGQKDQQDD